jgi:hypothetical protein
METGKSRPQTQGKYRSFFVSLGRQVRRETTQIVLAEKQTLQLTLASCE